MDFNIYIQFYGLNLPSFNYPNLCLIALTPVWNMAAPIFLHPHQTQELLCFKNFPNLIGKRWCLVLIFSLHMIFRDSLPVIFSRSIQEGIFTIFQKATQMPAKSTLVDYVFPSYTCGHAVMLLTLTLTSMEMRLHRAGFFHDPQVQVRDVGKTT